MRVQETSNLEFAWKNIYSDEPSDETTQVVSKTVMEFTDHGTTTTIIWNLIKETQDSRSRDNVANDITDIVIAAYDTYSTNKVDTDTLANDDPPIAIATPISTGFRDRHICPYNGPLLKTSPSIIKLGLYSNQEITALLQIKAEIKPVVNMVL